MDIRKEVGRMLIIGAVIAGIVLAPIFLVLLWVKDKWERL
jgi:hypothetical protein